MQPLSICFSEITLVFNGRMALNFVHLLVSHFDVLSVQISKPINPHGPVIYDCHNWGHGEAEFASRGLPTCTADKRAA